MQEQINSNFEICKCCSMDIIGEIDNADRALQCLQCNKYVHLNCLQRGAVPGSLIGDSFFKYKCMDCSPNNTEQFERDKMTWLQIIILVVYHLQARQAALARKGFFHWKTHIAAFIDRNWDILFKSDTKRKKKWTGTVSGTLSHYSPIFFKSGTVVLCEQGWWALTYPKLPPKIIGELNEELMLEKQKCKEFKLQFNNMEKLKEILELKPYAKEAIPDPSDFSIDSCASGVDTQCTTYDTQQNLSKSLLTTKRKTSNQPFLKKDFLLPTVDNILSHIKRRNIAYTEYATPSSNEFKKLKIEPFGNIGVKAETRIEEKETIKTPLFIDPLCHYNTSLEGLNQLALETRARLTGSIQKDFILSPYSSICLSPYIWRARSLQPPWLQLMDELKCKVNHKTKGWKLEVRAPLDFTYVHPDHIPAINSLCSHFFWKGINLTEILQYPEYTCVVLYKKLIVGFLCVVPNVATNEMYLSFIFTRPAWRKCGIGTFMLYHLIQVSGGKNITLHVPTTNSALFLFQKYGFKVQYFKKNFYGKYLPDHSVESKDAFFCKLNLEC